MRKRAVFRAGLALTLCQLVAPARSHELESDRLTMVLREPNHVSLTFRVDEASLMRRLLAPRSSAADFLLPLTSMNDADFAAVVKRARSRFEQGLGLRDASGRPMLLRGWHWPEVSEVRARIRFTVMQGIVDTANHEHAPPAEISVDALAVSAIDGVDVKLPEGFEDLFVVSYKPTQRQWRAKEKTPLVVRFP